MYAFLGWVGASNITTIFIYCENFKNNLNYLNSSNYYIFSDFK